jgi:uncharacterized membrane protein
MFRDRRLPLAVPICLMLAALLFAILDLVFQYDELPRQMASHFDFHGRATGWGPKLQFVVLEAVALVMMTALPVAIVLTAYYAPAALLNIPHGEYWLAEEREAESRRAIASWGLWFAAVTLWFLALVFHETFAANRRQPPQLEWFWSLFAIYFLVFGFLLVQLIRRFGTPPVGASEFAAEENEA